MKQYIAISKVVSTSITQKMRAIKAIVFGKADVREANECSPFGTDSNPVAGMNAIYANTTVNGIPVIVGYINQQQLADIGENRHFSTDSNGNVVFNTWQRNDGTYLMGTSINPTDYTDFLLRYTELNLALQDYLTLLNVAIGTGIVSGGGTYTPPDPLDISQAKIPNMKVLPAAS